MTRRRPSELVRQEVMAAARTAFLGGFRDTWEAWTKRRKLELQRTEKNDAKRRKDGEP